MEGHVKRSREGRERLMDALAGHGATPVPSQGNFVFSDFGERAALVQDGLASLGIRVRRFPHRPEVATGVRITVPEGVEDLVRLEAGLNTVLSPEALLFDMDGVLADVEGSYRRCVFETAKSFGFPITRDDMETAVMAGDANNDWVLTQRLLKGQGVEIPLAEITERFQEIYLGTLGKPGLRDAEKLLIEGSTLEGLAARLPLGIVTGRPRDEAEWFLKKTGIGEFFRALVCLEDGPLKPNPEPVRTALSRLGVQRAWMVGDTPDDIRAAAAAEVVPFGIVAPGDDPDRAAAALLDAGAAAVIPDLSTLQEYLP